MPSFLLCLGFNNPLFGSSEWTSWLTLLFSGFSRLKKGTNEEQDQDMVYKDEGPVNDGGRNNGRQCLPVI